MADPSKRRASDAVCRLVADAFIEWANIAEPPEGPNRVRCWVEMVQPALTAYRREIAPLRSKAEVDAERLLNLDAWRRRVIDDSTLRFRDERLCREETAPEEEPTPGKECDWCQDSSLPKLVQRIVPEQRLWVCEQCIRDRQLAGAKPEWAEAMPTVQRAHASDKPELQDPESCGCEQAELLRKRLRDINRLCAVKAQITSEDQLQIHWWSKLEEP